MEGSVLSFLKAEWKVSDTGSAHWASSSFSQSWPFNTGLTVLWFVLSFLWYSSPPLIRTLLPSHHLSYQARFQMHLDIHCTTKWSMLQYISYFDNLNELIHPLLSQKIQHYMVAIFVSNGTLSCLIPCFVYLASALSIKTFFLC
jgi:hypothetical protein